jgi:adenosine kinase
MRTGFTLSETRAALNHDNDQIRRKYMRIVVTGSLAYDYIMSFPGYFKEHILMEKAHVLSVSFLVDSMNKVRGGVAGNIAYNLALLGERPLLFGTVGQDFEGYREWLQRCGVDTSGLVEIEHEFTSSCFISTDKDNNQIVTFYPGAMAHAHKFSLKSLELETNDLVLISASDPAAMERCATECQQLGIPYVFDPGKQTPRLEANVIRTGLKGAKVLVGNEYEYGMMAKKLDMSIHDLITRTSLAVITRGGSGSTIYMNSAVGTDAHEHSFVDIPSVPIKQVSDPTGAGDAYLAGLVFGIARELPIEVTGRVASLAGAYAVEERGPHEHAYSAKEFIARYESVFGDSTPLKAVMTS